MVSFVISLGSILSTFRVIFPLLFLLIPTVVSAQGSSDYGKGLKFEFDEAQNKFVRFVFWNQFWAGPIQNNPGTLINGEASKSTFLTGARRMRILAHTQISSRYLIVLHIGINNHTFSSGGGSGTSGTGANGSAKKPQLFFHDAYNEYALFPATDPEGNPNSFSLYAGAGLHYWNGVSRLTSASTLNMLMVDAPVFNWPLVEVSDQFGRQFGFYVKGALRRLHYQFHLNKPFVTGLTPPTNANIAVDNNGDPAPAYGGYVDVQLLEKESQVLPYRVGTYVGTKRVFNLGAGFYHHDQGTKSSSASGAVNSHPITLFGIDAFADLPIGNVEKNMAVTGYLVYYNYNFGPNYLRTAGICNPGVIDIDVPNHNQVLEGAGNSRILLGTGQKLYLQGGLLLPRIKNSKLRVQPVGAIAYKSLEQLEENGTYWDAGTNIYIDGHHAKITLQYSSRPLYDSVSKLIKDRKGEFIIQFQIYL